MDGKGRLLLKMKKDRIVGLCICLALLANLHALRVACCHHSAASFMPRAVWSVISGEHFGIGVYPFVALSEIKPADLPPGPFFDLVCEGWPPVGFLYGEMRLISDKLMRELRAATPRLYRQDRSKSKISGIKNVARLRVPAAAQQLSARSLRQTGGREASWQELCYLA